MVKRLEIQDFLAAPEPMLDVRSPGEYNQGHIPGAISYPLFSNEERAQVGICYKQQGRDAAVELGFDLLGPKLGTMVRWAKNIAPNRTVRVHCWRGGMRSGGVGWGLQMAGFQVTTLEGGYKAFRRWARHVFETSRQIIVLGGMTGTGKTHILHALQDLGEQVLDLEGLANHRGSSFGSLDMPPQPTTEHYENLICDRLSQLDSQRPVWIEAESRRVGVCRVPAELFQQMEIAPTLEIVRSIDERLDILVEVYGETNRDELVAATERIRKRLGGQRTQAAVDLIRQEQPREVCKVVLDYYDRTYRHDLERRNKIIPQVDVSGLTPKAAAQLLVKKAPFLVSTSVSLT
ncbi:tRNA 2-selenouridine(34) synthase MnmH [Oscillatoria sp. CS-180]|uniref:tRNA 2-selenouridine(34) synthase MnmH n=1 Tax=Oscillatoria sp. CS-180 TaxID=3021720 RepID=UPI00232F4234|nr:tRNA 2-selenouridine(34) synthase MnmH [Oscillatoria sp. CS-180]MDB9529026.1 tRNA 2-selenouridine(34) synthase MnmH [Oscillatoria sp. CS-180]